MELASAGKSGQQPLGVEDRGPEAQGGRPRRPRAVPDGAGRKRHRGGRSIRRKRLPAAGGGPAIYLRLGEVEIPDQAVSRRTGGAGSGNHQGNAAPEDSGNLPAAGNRI